MRTSRPEYDPAKTIVFIIIGAVMVIFADMYLFGGNNTVWSNSTTTKQNKLEITSFLDVKDLQKRHDQYMKEGILPPFSSRRPFETASTTAMDNDLQPFLPIQPFEIPPEVSLPQSKPDKLAKNDAPSNDLLKDVTDTTDNILNIEPASGDNLYEPENKPLSPPENQKSEVDTKTEFSEEFEIGTKSQRQAQSQDLLLDNPTTLENVPAKIEEISSTNNSSEVKNINSQNKPRIAIIIDDMGVSLRSRQLEVMKNSITFSYLPYASNLKARTAIAKNNGHELMVHMPMEAMHDKNGGPRILKQNNSDQEFKDTIEWGLSQFEGYVGVNNHQGSKLTQDETSMKKFMNILKEKNVYFVDSKTIGSSIAEETAAHHGIAHASRDVFLDHEISRGFVDQALKDLEAIARYKGSAIAIGHPHKETIEALKDWLPTLKEKGIELVPVSALIQKAKPETNNLVLVSQKHNANDQLDNSIYNSIEPSSSSSESESKSTSESLSAHSSAKIADQNLVTQ